MHSATAPSRPSISARRAPSWSSSGSRSVSITSRRCGRRLHACRRQAAISRRRTKRSSSTRTRSRPSSALGPTARFRSAGRPCALLQAQGIPADCLDRPRRAASRHRGARSRVEAAAQRIKEARAAFYPNVNLRPSSACSPSARQSLSGGSAFGSVGPAISLPIFHGGALQGQYRGRRGQYDEAVALYDCHVIKALRETADAVTSQKMLVSAAGGLAQCAGRFRGGASARAAALRTGPRDLPRRAFRGGGRRSRALQVAQLEVACLHPRRAAGPRPRRRVHGCLTQPHRR